MCFATMGCCDGGLFDIYGIWPVTYKPYFERCGSSIPVSAPVPNISEKVWRIPISDPFTAVLGVLVGGLVSTEPEFAWTFERRKQTATSSAFTEYVVCYDIEAKVEKFKLTRSQFPTDAPLPFNVIAPTAVFPNGIAFNQSIADADSLYWAFPKTTTNDNFMLHLNTTGQIESIPIPGSNNGSYFDRTTMTCYLDLTYNGDGVLVHSRAIRVDRANTRCWPAVQGIERIRDVNLDSFGNVTSSTITENIIHGHLIFDDVYSHDFPGIVGFVPLPVKKRGFSVAIDHVVFTQTYTADISNNPFGHLNFLLNVDLVNPGPSWIAPDPVLTSPSWIRCDCSKSNYIGVYYNTAYSGLIIPTIAGIQGSGLTDGTFIQDGTVIFSVSTQNFVAYSMQGFGGFACATVSRDGGTHWMVKGYIGGQEIWSTQPILDPLQPVDINENWVYLSASAGSLVGGTSARTACRDMPNCEYPSANVYNDWVIRVDGSASVPLGRKFSDKPPNITSPGNPERFDDETALMETFAAVRRHKVPFGLPSTSF